MRCLLPAIAACIFCLSTAAIQADDRDKLDFFENHIRPLLVEKCASCHGEEIQENGFRVDSRDGMLEGGQRGDAIVPGDASASLLFRMVSGQEGEDLTMPPDGDTLSKEEQQHIAIWINQGAVWSGEQRSASDGPFARMKEIHDTHWAYQPIVMPITPSNPDSTWPRGVIDEFIFARLAKSGLTPSPEADRPTLIRRAYFDLIGLPPTYEQVESFIRDSRENAYELMIDELLNRPEYGQRWGRHWLDVARYSDTRGHTNFPGTEIRYPFAWTYRDYVINAMNADLPFDQFVTQQLAADLEIDTDTNGAQQNLAALGFLTVGRRFLNRQHRILGERVDLVSRGLMGVTIMCAKCHDHKFDPFSMHDFYALYGIFENAAEPLPSELPQIGPAHDVDPQRASILRPQLEEELATFTQEAAALRIKLILEELRQKAEFYLPLAAASAEGEALETVKIGDHERWSRIGIEMWKAFITKNSVLSPWWTTLVAIESPDGESYAAELAAALTNGPSGNRLIREKILEEKPESTATAMQAIGQALTSVSDRWEKLQTLDPGDQGFADPAAEEIRLMMEEISEQVAEAPEAAHREWFLGRTPAPLREQSQKFDLLLMKYRELLPRRAMAVVDNPLALDASIQIRGNPKKRGSTARRGFYELLANDCEVEPIKRGSGRAELARWITHRGNPLTARVIANRIWGWHFGSHLVETPSDFGTRASEPTHPQLLDYLAATLRDEGWSMKDLHREIMLSATYRQQSLSRDDALAVDPDNRLYWRKNCRRLEFEPMRDAMLAASGELDPSLGGPPAEDFESPRRSVYLLHNRRSMAPVLPTFDVPAADATLPKRSETTVPQQALYLMNHGFVTRRAEHVARRSAHDSDASDADRIISLYRHIYGRDPSAAELADAQAFVTEAEFEFVSDPQAAMQLPPEDACWKYGTGRIDQDQNDVVDFDPLPHFDGRCWWQQADRTWQDAFLDGQGGRPGRQMAVIRRWQAPKDSVGDRYILRGTFVAGPHMGDGVDIYVVSSREGLLKTVGRAEPGSMDIHVENLQIKSGDVIDLVVAPRKDNAFDDFSWSPRIVEVGTTASGSPYAANEWRSDEAFSRSVPYWQGGLDPWEQLAQVLLMSNEFMFVD